MKKDKLHIKLFSDLSDEQIEKLYAIAKTITLKPNDTLFHESTEPDHLYVILSGSVAVEKIYKPTGKFHRVSTLTKDHTIGEMALIESERRSATIIALTKSKLLEIPISEIKKDAKILAVLAKNISQTLSQRLRKINEITIKSMQNELDELQKRNALGMVSLTIIYVLALYVLTLNIMRNLPVTTVVTAPVGIIVGIVIFYVIRKSQFPYPLFGLTLTGWKQALKESLLFSAIAMIFLLALKYVVVKYQLTSIKHVFSAIHDLNTPRSYVIYWSTLIAYILIAPMQEFIARGGFQSSFYHFLTGSETKRRWLAIISSNILYSLTHLHQAYEFAYIVFLPGLFWGWLYSRHKTLVGVSVSHMLIGMWAFFILGIGY